MFEKEQRRRRWLNVFNINRELLLDVSIIDSHGTAWSWPWNLTTTYILSPCPLEPLVENRNRDESPMNNEPLMWCYTAVVKVQFGLGKTFFFKDIMLWFGGNNKTWLGLGNNRGHASQQCHPPSSIYRRQRCVGEPGGKSWKIMTFSAIMGIIVIVVVVKVPSAVTGDQQPLETGQMRQNKAI